MNELYKSALNKLEISKERKEEIHTALIKTDNTIKTSKHKKLFIAVSIAAVFALIVIAIPNTRMGIVKAAEYFRKLLTLSNGTEVILNREEDSTSVSFDNDDYDTNKYVEVSDGQVFFVFEDTKINITDKCSDTTYYRYDITDEKGMLHIIFVGGPIDSIGWAEFVFDIDGTYLTNLMSVPKEDNWLNGAMESIGVPNGEPR